MKTLIIGNGGREQAMVYALSQSPKVERVFVAEGNGGTSSIPKAENISAKTHQEILTFAKKEDIDLTIVGPEAFLVDGIVDIFEQEGLKIIGANQKSAQLEGSKIFAKKFMQKHKIRTASFAEFDNYYEAERFIKERNEYPIVIKADGLAAGKGVVIAENESHATETLKSFMQDKKFGKAGQKIVVEQFLKGFEVSILTLFDGDTILPFLSAKDHKQIFDGDKGPNTGGMGVLAPNPLLTEDQYQDFLEHILQKTLQGIKAEKLGFKGFIFFGLMVQSHEVFLLEYNIRLGDPETQAILPLLNIDFYELMEQCWEKNLKSVSLDWKPQKSCCVTLASEGYPEGYETGKTISLPEEKDEDIIIFHAGTKEHNEKILTSGGRVLNVVGLGNNLEEARKKAYQKVDEINFEGKYFRTDIGKPQPFK